MGLPYLRQDRAEVFSCNGTSGGAQAGEGEGEGGRQIMALLKLKLKKLSPEVEALFRVRPPVRVKIVLIKERRLKRLHELSLKSAEQKPQLEEPTEEQSQWIERKMKGSARNWQRWNEGIYFTEEQKQEMGIK